MLHAAGLVHGDLKPRNLVRVNNEFVLIDFDASLKEGGEMAKVSASSFCPPEVARTLYLVPGDEEPISPGGRPLDSRSRGTVARPRNLGSAKGSQNLARRLDSHDAPKVVRLPGRQHLERRMKSPASGLNLLAMAKAERKRPTKGGGATQSEGSSAELENDGRSSMPSFGRSSMTSASPTNRSSRHGSMARVVDPAMRLNLHLAFEVGSVISSTHKPGTVVTEHLLHSLEAYGKKVPAMKFSYDVWSFGVILWIAVMNRDLHADVSRSTGDIDSTESMKKLINWDGLPASLEDKVLEKYGERATSTESTRKLAWRALDLIKWCLQKNPK